MGCNSSKKADIKESHQRESSGYPHLPESEVPSLSKRYDKPQSAAAAAGYPSISKALAAGDGPDVSYTEKREGQEEILRKIVLQASQEFIDIGASSPTPNSIPIHTNQGSYLSQSLKETAKEWQTLPKDLLLDAFSLPTPSASNSSAGVKVGDLLQTDATSATEGGSTPPSFLRRFASIGDELKHAMKETMYVVECGDIVVAFGSVPDTSSSMHSVSSSLPTSKTKTQPKQPKIPPPPAYPQPSSSLY